MTMTHALKQRFVLIMALFLSAGFIQSLDNHVLADDIIPGKIAKPTFKFPRSIKKGDGHGGFAYRGVRQELQIEDFALAAIEKAPSSSAWQESEKKLYGDLLALKKYDLLVVPFQTQLDGVDDIGRALMSYRLAMEVERRTNLRVAPMPLVHLAFGLTARVIDDEQVYSLARQMGCRQVVWGFAGTHEDSLGHVEGLSVTIATQAVGDFGTAMGIRSKSWARLDLGSNQLPSILFEKKLSEVMSFLGFPEAAREKAVSHPEVACPDIPPSPATLFQNQAADPIEQSYLFQFMGELIPLRSEFHRRYMFIRSLCALAGADASHPDYALLKARAYFHLHRRPAALEVLGDHQSPEAVFLVQSLNGNLPLMKGALDRIEAPLHKFFAAVEYLTLKEYYTGVLDEPLIKSIVSQHSPWSYFFDLILNDQDVWDLRPNLPIKQCLDAYFPLQGFSLKDLDARQSSQKTPEAMAAVSDLSFQEHIRRKLASEPLLNLLSAHRQGPALLDYLLMLEGIGQSNLVKRVWFYQKIQGLPDEALKTCNQFLKSYSGHPYFHLIHAGILEEKADLLQGEQKTRLLETAFQAAQDGLWWYGGQGWAYRKAESILLSSSASSLRKSAPFKQLLYGIACDYPPLTDCARSGNMRPLEDLIDWSTGDIDGLATMVNIYAKADPEKARALIATKLSGRFLGHPRRHMAELREQAMNDPGDDPKISYIRMISQGTRMWKIYNSLGKLYIDEGRYAKARDVFLSYPGFQSGAPENRVGLSNMAYFAGSYLFLQGAWAEARPLYELSAGLRTGSAACLTSQGRLALLDRNFTAAAQIMLQCAQRYDIAHRYRDYMSLSHLLGDSKAAWQMFLTLLGRYPLPPIWTSAFVGHRLQRTGKQKLMQWIGDMARQNQTSRQRSFPARFGLLCLIDRPPDLAFADFIDTIDELTRYQFKGKWVLGPDNRNLGPEPFGMLDNMEVQNLQEYIQAQNRYYTGAIPDRPFSFYSSFARAYEHLKNKAYAESYRILKERSLLYSYEERTLGAAFKPYLVRAGLKSGHGKAMAYYLSPKLVEAGLKKPPTEQSGFFMPRGGSYGSVKRFSFDDELALAVYLGWAGHHGAALERLKNAFSWMPATGDRPLFPWYQIVEVCEWLYEDSKEQGYLDLALKWVKDYQVIQPMFAWAFAFEAKHTQKPDDRIRALGYALYLDPQSWWISAFAEKEKQAARDWFRDHNPFL